MSQGEDDPSFSIKKRTASKTFSDESVAKKARYELIVFENEEEIRAAKPKELKSYLRANGKEPHMAQHKATYVEQALQVWQKQREKSSEVKEPNDEPMMGDESSKENLKPPKLEDDKPESTYPVIKVKLESPCSRKRSATDSEFPKPKKKKLEFKMTPRQSLTINPVNIPSTSRLDTDDSEPPEHEKSPRAAIIQQKPEPSRLITESRPALLELITPQSQIPTQFMPCPDLKPNLEEKSFSLSPLKFFQSQSQQHIPSADSLFHNEKTDITINPNEDQKSEETPILIDSNITEASGTSKQTYNKTLCLIISLIFTILFLYQNISFSKDTPQPVFCIDQDYALVNGDMTRDCSPCPNYADCVEGEMICIDGYERENNACVHSEQTEMKTRIENSVKTLLKIRALTFDDLKLEVKNALQIKHDDPDFDEAFELMEAECEAGLSSKIYLDDDKVRLVRNKLNRNLSGSNYMISTFSFTVAVVFATAYSLI